MSGGSRLIVRTILYDQCRFFHRPLPDRTLLPIRTNVTPRHMPQGSKVAPADAIVNLHAVFTRYAPFSSDACLITNSRKITAPGRRAEERVHAAAADREPEPEGRRAHKRTEARDTLVRLCAH